MNSTQGARIRSSFRWTFILSIAVLALLPQAASADPVGPHDVTFLGVTPDGGNYKWSYEITSNGDYNAISHVEWYLCVPCGEIVSVDADGDGFGGDAYECDDMGGGIYRFKIQVGWGDGETRTVFFVLDTYHPVDLTDVGVKYGNELDSAQVFGPICPDPEYVDLAWASASPGNDGVLLEWETGTEISNLGFNIYRSGEDDFATAARVNDQFILSKAVGSLAGASYEFTDTSAVQGTYYYYWIQDVSSAGAYAEVDGYTGVHALGRAIWFTPKFLRVLPLTEQVKSPGR